MLIIIIICMHRSAIIFAHASLPQDVVAEAAEERASDVVCSHRGQRGEDTRRQGRRLLSERAK